MEFSKYQFIGKLNTEFLEIEFGKLATNELILTDERDEHIKERHAKDMPKITTYFINAFMM